MIDAPTANAVVLPGNLRVEQFQQLWLVKHGIVTENSNGFFTPIAIQCSDEFIELLIVQNRIQITGKGTLEEASGNASTKMLALMRAAAADDMQVIGCGLNFKSVVCSEDNQGLPRSIESLYFQENELLRHASKSRHCGFTVVEDFDHYKITTTLSTERHLATSQIGAAVDFNFHADVKDLAGIETFYARSGEFLATVEERIAIVHGQMFSVNA